MFGIGIDHGPMWTDFTPILAYVTTSIVYITQVSAGFLSSPLLVRSLFCDIVY